MNYQGSELQLWTGSGNTAHTFACATSLSVNINRDSLDIACKDCGPYGASLPGTITWDISTNCLYTTSGSGSGATNHYADMVDAMIAGTPILCTWASVSNYDTAVTGGGDTEGHIFNDTTKAKSANDLYYGYAVITSVELTADNGSVAEYSVSLQGKGALNKGGVGPAA